MATTNIEVTTGSDAFILTSSNDEKLIIAADPDEREFRLTITIAWEEYRQPNQTAGTLWLEYQLGKTTPSLPGIEAVVPVENQSPRNNYFLIATRGLVSIHYTGQANAHVWLSYYAEHVR
jgi:hypothetical protein